MLKKYGILKMLALPAIEFKHTVSNDNKKWISISIQIMSPIV